MAFDPVLKQLEATPELVVELPRGTMVKRRGDGSVDFISPLPCPYNYGSIPGLVAGDGDPLDALVLGPRLPKGSRVRAAVVAVVDFRDDGLPDPKVVCSDHPLSLTERAGLAAFFTAYGLAKRALGLVRGKRGETRFAGFVPESVWR